MLTAFVSAMKTPDLRRKILFTLAMLAIYRAGTSIPSPGVNYKAVNTCLDEVGGSSDAFTLLNLFSGGALLQLSIFALGIMPYITASIIVQLLVVVIPRFEQLKQEGQSGQAKMTQYTRYITIGLGVLQSSAFLALALNGQMFGGCSVGDQVIYDRDNFFTLFVLVLTMTAGTTAIMWLGELITDRGVGNGMSLLIMTSIAARIVPEGQNILGTSGGVIFGVLTAFAVAVTIAVIYIEQGQRRLPVQYAKRMVGRKMYGGTSTYLPLKVNAGGVIPVIFASSLLYIPTLITSLVAPTALDEETGEVVANPAVQWVQYYIADPGTWSHMLLYFLLIIFFTYFYVGIQFNPVERADDLKRYGGFIPGIRPGRPTAEYLQFVLSRITLPGSLYLGVVAIMPDFFLSITGPGNNQNFPFGGVSVLIMVAVGLDTMKQIESQLMQRNYEGFLR